MEEGKAWLRSYVNVMVICIIMRKPIRRACAYNNNGCYEHTYTILKLKWFVSGTVVRSAIVLCGVRQERRKDKCQIPLETLCRAQGVFTSLKQRSKIH